MPLRVPSGKKRTALLRRLKAVFRRLRSHSVAQLIAVINPLLRGWVTISDSTEQHLAWTAVWKHSILRSVLHHLRDQILDRDGDVPKRRRARRNEPDSDSSAIKANQAPIDQLLPQNRSLPLRPFHYYIDITNQLDSSTRDTLRQIRQELSKLDTLLQLNTRTVNVFLDNLDDYYELHPHLWYQSIYGQFRAVREISLAYRHVHLFTSIRQDVYSQFEDEMRLQYYDYVSELKYSKDELLSIFSTGIVGLDRDLLSNPRAYDIDAWSAFFGELTTVPNDFIGGAEDIQSYIHRHTLGRPRDMIHMGTVLLNNRSTDGFTLEAIRASVAKAAEDICRQYLAEVRPQLDPRFDIPEFVSKYIPSNILTAEDIAEVTLKFLEARRDVADKETPSDLSKPFETLSPRRFLARATGRTGLRPR